MNALARDPKQRTAMLLAAIALAMVALGFASVPLYRMFCQVTGLNGTTQRGLRAPGAIDGRTMTIRFDANHAPGLPWSFKPEEGTQGVTIGEREQAVFVAHNNGSKPITGTATFNVTPVQAGKYFTKIQCFCFTQQTLAPGETARMPVIYYVDPKILDDADARDIDEITLSYTFYPVADQPKAG